MYKHLATTRLRLRPILLGDAAFILEIVNTDGWLQFIGNRNVANLGQAERYIRQILDNARLYYHVVELKATGQLIGIVTFLHRDYQPHPDIGFALLPAFEKHGYALEACQAYLEEVLKTGAFANVLGITLPHNSKSINLLTKLGLGYQHDFARDGETLSLYSLEPLPAT
jgi:[ribosomal protein S5]-alanine N-acetyltransferase